MPPVDTGQAELAEERKVIQQVLSGTPDPVVSQSKSNLKTCLSKSNLKTHQSKSNLKTYQSKSNLMTC